MNKRGTVLVLTKFRIRGKAPSFSRHLTSNCSYNKCCGRKTACSISEGVRVDPSWGEDGKPGWAIGCLREGEEACGRGGGSWQREGLEANCNIRLCDRVGVVKNEGSSHFSLTALLSPTVLFPGYSHPLSSSPLFVTFKSVEFCVFLFFRNAFVNCPRPAPWMMSSSFITWFLVTTS